MIDIVVPNYNKVDFIKECVASLRKQTFSDWRCIVIDGYSDDGSWEVLQKVAGEDDRFELHQLDRIGLYKSWNFGLRKVRNPYFAILTSDDLWDPQWLGVALSALEQHEQVIAAAARTKYIDEAGQVGPVARRNAIGESLFLNDRDSSPVVWDGLNCSVAGYFMGTIFNSIHSFVARSTLLDDFLFPTDVGSAADLEWSMQIGLHGDVVYCPHVPAYWRRYDEQASSQTMDQREELGENILTMIRRTKPKIQRRLSGRQRQQFQEASEKYTQTLLPYFFERPPLNAFKERPLKAGFRALRAGSVHPDLFIGGLHNFIRGRERYLIEQRLALARHVLGLEGK